MIFSLMRIKGRYIDKERGTQKIGGGEIVKNVGKDQRKATRLLFIYGFPVISAPGAFEIEIKDCHF